MSGRAVAEAYSSTGAAWAGGPSRIYRRLADELVARVPHGVAGRDVLDLGAGTGAAESAAIAAGAAGVVALDTAIGLLQVERSTRPPAVAGDARSLPFRDASFDTVLAAFSLNHLADPATALAEVRRVLRPGGGAAVSAYSADDAHPAKEAVERACRELGWSPPAWYRHVRAEAIPRLATPERALHEAVRAGMVDARAEVVRVSFPELDVAAMVAWRMGMAQVAPFVAALDPSTRAALTENACRLLGPDAPVIVRAMVVLTWRSCG